VAGRTNLPPPVVIPAARKMIPPKGKIDPVPPQRGLGQHTSIPRNTPLEKTTYSMEEIQYKVESQIEDIKTTI